MNEPIPWARVEMALRQYASSEGLPLDRVEVVLQELPHLIDVCGDMSQTRKVAYRVGMSMLHGAPKILVPVCPAYSHRQGKYTYEGVNGGIPLLVRVHVPFLEEVMRVLPQTSVEFLIADQEAQSEPLCRILKITPEEFSEKVRRSVTYARTHVQAHGWNVSLMTEEVPDWVERETQAMQWIREREWFDRTLKADVKAREKVYKAIGYRSDEWAERSLRTAAQYITLGFYAKEREHLIVNHETPSLFWYLRTGVGFLHNPTRVY